MCPGNIGRPKVLLPVFYQRIPDKMPEKLFQRIRKILFIARKIFLNRGMDEMRKIEGVNLPLLNRHISRNAPDFQDSSSRIN